MMWWLIGAAVVVAVIGVLFYGAWVATEDERKLWLHRYDDMEDGL